MPALVALALRAGSGWVDELRRAWDVGDAVLPLDPRLPGPAAEAVLAALRPSWVVGPGGDRTPRAGGVAVEDGDALVVATSGTTAAPKGVVLTHDAVRASALATSVRLGVVADRDRWLACLPLAHIGGLSVVTRSLVTGSGLVVHDAFDAAAVTAVAIDGPTFVALVPTACDRVDPSLFRAVVLGGSADWRDRPPNVVRTYGMTETGSGVVYDGLPIDGVEVRTDGDGQILVRGPMLLRCYRDGTDPKDPGGWLATGDAGRVDANGRLHVSGRLSDMIVTGGENVWPEPVEEVLRRHPDVRDVAVVGRPDGEWGERVVAVVVARDGARPPTLDELRAWTKERLPAYAAPREIELVDVLPRTALGKIARRSL